MATAVDSIPPREEALASPSPHLSILEIWHLLSLDAPTVAALWAWFFARAVRIDLPWYAPLLLAIGTWLIYITDRILDGYHPSPAAPLRPRHRFHARHRRAFLIAAVAAGSLLLWLIVARMTSSARYEDTVLFLIALAYLCIVHRPGKGSRPWLPKELAVGVVFAAATAVPAWSRLDSGRAALFPAVLLFAALCWLNCVAIERWEEEHGEEEPQGGNPEQGRPERWVSPVHPQPAQAASHSTTRWIADHFRLAALALAIPAAISAAIGPLLQPTLNSPAVYFAIAAGAAGLALMDTCRKRFSQTQLRIAADLILLTPLLFLPFLG